MTGPADSSDIELAFTTKGEGEPAIMLIHGFCCAYDDWQPQIEALNKRTRVIAPDLRGHARSPRGEADMTIEQLATDCVALARAQGISSMVVGGHSMGTRVALEVRHQAPELVNGLILFDGSDTAYGDAQASRQAFEDAVAHKGFTAWARGLFEIMFFDEKYAEIAGPIIERALAVPEATAASLYRNMMQWDATRAEPIMRALDVPTLVIQSTTRGADGIRRALRDGEIGHYPELVRSRAPAAEIKALAGHGHFTGLEAPDWTNDVVTGWAERQGFFG